MPHAAGAHAGTSHPHSIPHSFLASPRRFVWIASDVSAPATTPAMTAMTATSVPSTTTNLRLSVMMFLQFFVWGAWFVTLGKCLSENGLAAVSSYAYGTAPIAAMIAPLILGLLADRFFPSEKVMGVLFLIGGALMCAVPHFAAAGQADIVRWLFLGHMLCYMPTLGLSNTIAFSNISDQSKFPALRVWGTVGWIVAGLVTGMLGWSFSLNMFMLAGVAALILGVFCFFLPHTPPPAKGQPVNFRTLFMLDALSLFKKPAFAVFLISSTLICIPLAYYYGITSYFLSDTGFVQPASAMTIGQMSEIIFMLLIPFFFRRLGVKWMIIVGMLAWVLRYLLFAFGAPEQVVWMILLGIALHGICYDFFFVTGFIYADKTAPATVRGQAQGLLVFLTQGVGMYFGYKIAFAKMGTQLTNQPALAEAIATARPEQETTFLQQLGQMFKVDLPEVDPALLTKAMSEWKAFWIYPAVMAAVITVVFFFAFWDKVKTDP
jgi:nucleoside transporter